MRISTARLPLLLSVLMAVPCAAANGPFVGKFSDGNLTVELSATSEAGAYVGTITLAEKKFPTTARARGSQLGGTFTSGTDSFPFTGALDGDTLVLSSAGSAYTLKRQGGAVNPLVAAQPANPLAQSSSGDGPRGYTVEVTTDAGKSLVAQKANIGSVKAALEVTFPELAAYFGERPVIGSAYQDAKDPNAGGATFSATANGHAVKGFVSCKLHDGGATVAVIYGRSDATKAEWDTLMNPPTQAGGAAPTAAAPANPGIPLQQYDFPDGTGSVGVADGWKTTAPTAIHAVVITGPADQVVIMGNGVTVLTPDSPTVKMMQQNQAMMQQLQARNQRMGMRSMPPPPMMPQLIAPFTTPVEALTTLAPQFSARSEFNHGPSVVLDKIISSEDVPTQLQGGKAAKILYACTRTVNGQSTAFRAKLHLQMCPLIMNGAWMWFATSQSAPDATFDHDLPIMQAMVSSLKMNEQRVKEVSDAENAQVRQMTQQMAQDSQRQLENNARQFQIDQDRRNATYQQQHDAQMAGYAQHNAQWQSDELQKSRNAADFIETIKGTRTVYDTQTGASSTVDLNYSTGVVNSLNEAAMDPNRFVQIPLRDEMYPVPGK